MKIHKYLFSILIIYLFAIFMLPQSVNAAASLQELDDSDVNTVCINYPLDLSNSSYNYKHVYQEISLNVNEDGSITLPTLDDVTNFYGNYKFYSSNSPSSNGRYIPSMYYSVFEYADNLKTQIKVNEKIKKIVWVAANFSKEKYSFDNGGIIYSLGLKNYKNNCTRLYDGVYEGTLTKDELNKIKGYVKRGVVEMYPIFVTETDIEYDASPNIFENNNTKFNQHCEAYWGLTFPKESNGKESIDIYKKTIKNNDLPNINLCGNQLNVGWSFVGLYTEGGEQLEQKLSLGPDFLDLVSYDNIKAYSVTKPIDSNTKFGIKCADSVRWHTNADDSFYYTVPNSLIETVIYNDGNSTRYAGNDFVVDYSDTIILPELDSYSITYRDNNNYTESITKTYIFDGWYLEAGENYYKTGDYISPRTDVIGEKITSITPKDIDSKYYRNHIITEDDVDSDKVDFVIYIYPKWIIEGEDDSSDDIEDATTEENNTSEDVSTESDTEAKDITDTTSTQEKTTEVAATTTTAKQEAGQIIPATTTEETIKKLSKVTSIKGINKKGRKAYITWKAVTDAKSYELQIATKKNMKKGLKNYIISKTTHTIKKLKKGKTYYIRVRGLSDDYEGKWSKITKVKIKK